MHVFDLISTNSTDLISFVFIRYLQSMKVMILGMEVDLAFHNCDFGE